MREYLLVMMTAGLTTYLLAGGCRQLALRWGAVAKVRARDVHTVPIPYFGGPAMLGGLLLACLLARNLPFLGRHPVVSDDALTICLAGAVICAVGVIDDLLDLPALAKAAGQVLAAGIAVTGGVRMFWIPLPNSIIALGTATSILVTVFFIVLCANAVNFVDGLDGLAAGVVAVGALAFFSYTYLLAHEQDLVVATTASLITAVTAGACLGFLPHNWHPARMFMGDSGALLLGFLLATSTISLTGQIDSTVLTARNGGLVPAYLPIVMPLMVMAIPLLDLVMGYVRRTWHGTWFFVADKQHLHHRLLQRGHSHVRAVLLMYLWTAVLSFGTVGIGLVQRWWVIGAVAGAVVLCIVLTVANSRVPARRAARRQL
ncbi:MraY family glycosyltransferase [Acidipropionibacterium timonense]|uniref:MraY family glycosyltransferase n=1 Tax=Acidipropionibacterium timonense TaxID=2161818 RepID=UPI0010325CA3|nr:MraY family glycosyltransferase [Acidipropionibacterium timonense]